MIYQHGYSPAELRERFTHRELPENVDQKVLSDLLLRLLELANAGLSARSLGEEKFLSPLFDRAERLTNPAKELLKGLAAGEKIEDWIERYSTF